MYTYTIIIPHKNIPKLLQRCLDSIPQRDDLEIIIVDDNSNPAVVDFDIFPGKDRKNTTIIFDKSGKGAGRARNIGLELANGKWLLFADADDYFYPKTFNELDEYSKLDYDVVYFYCNSRDGNTGEIIPDRVPDIKQGIEEKDYDRLRYRSFVPWGKFIKRDFVIKNHLSFEEVIASNDTWFSSMVGFHAKNIATISTPLYCCTRNENSLVFAPDINKIKTRIKVAARVNDFLYQHGKQRYKTLGIKWIFFFFPKYPFLFIWAIYKMRYKGDNILYLHLLMNEFMKRLKDKVKRLKSSILSSFC